MGAYELWALFAASLGGGGTVKLADIAYQEFRAWTDRRSSSTHNIDQTLEPLLKSADELVGKLRSLAEQDFTSIRRIEISDIQDPAFASLVYLFVQFWSQVEITRFAGMSASIARSRRGKWTQSFLTCLESRRVRLLDRISQRAIGEAVLVGGRTVNFVEFIRLYENDPYLKRWLEPLLAVLAKLGNTRERQRLLQYGVVIHAFIDTLDKGHLVTRDRPGTPNKLNSKSWNDLNYRVFSVYLPFVANRQKYIGPPKRRP